MTQDDKRYNILFLFTDDQRFGTIRALGNDQIHTPNMDYLVRNGTAFTNAYIMGGTCAAVCMPSRAMLMTGRTLFHLEDLGQNIPEDHRMLPEVFKDAGYTTFGTGKWHNGTAAYARSFTHGAEIFFGGMDDHWNVPACDFDPTGKYPEPQPHPWNPGTGDVEIHQKQFDHIKRGKHSSELFADAARDFLITHDTAIPFFMYVSFMAPHDPRTMPQEYLTMYDPEQILLPPNFMPEHPFENGDMRVRDESLEAWPRRPEKVRRHLAEYYAMITHLDAQIGGILDALKATGQFENTIIVFAGDNGLALGQHGLMGKQNNYDHSIHVPLVMMGPGIPAGEQREAFCYLIDIFPTLCDLTGRTIPETVEGKSLMPALNDPYEPHRNLLHFAYRDLHRSVMDRRFKLIEYVVEEQRNTQLFDRSKDPYELNNLADDPDYSKTLDELRTKLKCWRTEMDDWGDAFWSKRHGSKQCK